jgi:hypothetical protein
MLRKADQLFNYLSGLDGPVLVLSYRLFQQVREGA